MKFDLDSFLEGLKRNPMPIEVFTENFEYEKLVELREIGLINLRENKIYYSYIHILKGKTFDEQLNIFMQFLNERLPR